MLLTVQQENYMKTVFLRKANLQISLPSNPASSNVLSGKLSPDPLAAGAGADLQQVPFLMLGTIHSKLP